MTKKKTTPQKQNKPKRTRTPEQKELRALKRELKKVKELEAKGEKKYKELMIRQLRPELEYKVSLWEQKVKESKTK